MTPELTASVLALPQADLDHVLVHTQGWETLRGNRLLLTGGTGFIGKWLLGTFLHANRALGLNARVLILSRDVASFQAKHRALSHAPEIDWLQGDVRDFELSSTQSCSHVIHAATDVVASRSPSEIFDSCVRGTRQVLQQMQRAGAQHMLLLSSGAVYGPTPSTLERIPEDWAGAPDCLSTASAYGEGKRVSELLCAIAAVEHQLVIPIARCFAFVGPHLPLDKHFAIGNFIGAALEGRPIQIQGDGTPLRCYLYAADLAVWLWTMLFQAQQTRAYNVGGDEPLSIAQLAHRVVRVLDAPSPVIVAKQAIPGAAVQKYVPDLQLAANELGLHARISLDDAIQRTARWESRELS